MHGCDDTCTIENVCDNWHPINKIEPHPPEAPKIVCVIKAAPQGSVIFNFHFRI